MNIYYSDWCKIDFSQGVCFGDGMVNDGDRVEIGLIVFVYVEWCEVGLVLFDLIEMCKVCYKCLIDVIVVCGYGGFLMFDFLNICYVIDMINM